MTDPCREFDAIAAQLPSGAPAAVVLVLRLWAGAAQNANSPVARLSGIMADAVEELIAERDALIDERNVKIVMEVAPQSNACEELRRSFSWARLNLQKQQHYLAITRGAEPNAYGVVYASTPRRIREAEREVCDALDDLWRAQVAAGISVPTEA